MIRLPVFPVSSTPAFSFRRGWVFSLLCFCLAAGGSLRGAEPAPTPAPPPPVLESIQKATATELVGTMRNALAATVQTGVPKPADAAKAIPRKSQAFHVALAEASMAVDALATALDAKEKTPELFQTTRRVGTSLAALQVTFRYRGAEDDETEDHFRTLSAAYGVFRRNFGRDLLAAKNEEESALSTPQKAAFDALKKRGTELAKGLTALQAKVKENPAAAFETEAVLNAVTEVDKARRDHRRLLNTLASAELLLGRWAGTKLYVATVYPEDSAKLTPVDAAVAAYEAALKEGCDAAFATAGVDPGAVFAQSASYAEDLGAERLPEAEVTALLQSLRTPAPVPPADAPPAENTGAADRAADRQINADDPDDDTSLDAGDDDDPDGAATGKAND